MGPLLNTCENKTIYHNKDCVDECSSEYYIYNKYCVTKDECINQGGFIK